MIGDPTSQDCILRPVRFNEGCGMVYGEPALEEILAEPIVHLVARRDGVSIEELRTLCERVRWRLRNPVMLNQV